MNSGKSGFSLWEDEKFRCSLLAYVGRIYGQRGNVGRLLHHLRIGLNDSDDLDQFYDVIKELEKQPGLVKRKIKVFDN